MPELDGLSAIREIRRVGLVPVIVISAHQDLDLPTEGDASPTLFLTKPVNRQSLQEAIEAVMAGSGVT